MHRELRMVRGRRRGELSLAGRCTPPIELPRLVVEIGIEPRQHHRTLRQVGDGAQGISRSPASSRSSLPRSPGRHDVRSGARLPPRSSEVAPRRRLDSCRRLCRIFGPRLSWRYGGTCSVICQYWSSASGTSPSSALPFDACGLPCRPSTAPDRQPAPASMPGRRPPTAPASDLPGLSCFAHAAINCASNRRRCSPIHRRRHFQRSQRRRDAACANANSSSSMSPRAMMRGSIARRRFSSTSRKISRAIRPARRVGR